jgi:uncharacterized membrane protein YdjX (TVP38/TMEM64 family)
LPHPFGLSRSVLSHFLLFRGIGMFKRADQGTSRHRWLGYAGLALTMALVVIFATPLGLGLQQMAQPDYWVQAFQGLGIWSAPLFVSLFTGLTVVGIPGNMLAIAAGGIFGLAWGTVWSVLGATLGAVGAFGLARHCLHGWAEHRWGQHPLLQRLRRAIHHRPLNFVLMVRFAPISPFNLVNFLFGLTPLKLSTYALGTLVGIIPGTFAYVWLGVGGMEVMHGGDRWQLAAALGLLMLLSGFPLIQRLVQRKVQPLLNRGSSKPR